MFAQPEVVRPATGSRALVPLCAACVLCGLVVWSYCEHAPALIGAPALALYVLPAGFRPMSVPEPSPRPPSAPAQDAAMGSRSSSFSMLDQLCHVADGVQRAA